MTSELNLPDRPSDHFDFGRNWAEYAETIDDVAVVEAQQGVSRLFGDYDLNGKAFLDIGCGSGIHSLAAAQRGAKVTAIDIDADSVETTRRTLARFGCSADIRHLSVFDVGSLGKFDVVYSWGVLHHTGQMWRAIAAAASAVKPGGMFVIAIYRRTPMCGVWRAEKAVYTKAPSPFRAIARLMYGAAHLPLASIKRRVAPQTYLANYKKNRGMSYWHDIDDWMGGYPYESATSEQIVDFVSGLGFRAVQVAPAPKQIGFFGTGCSEFVFQQSDT